MLTEAARVRLSAQRALPGVIGPHVRLIKSALRGREIAFTVILDAPPSEEEHEALQVKAAEIVADFPDCDIVEQIVVDRGPLKLEDPFVEGWVYRRAEPAGGALGKGSSHEL